MKFHMSVGDDQKVSADAGGASTGGERGFVDSVAE
jgi:hypothetical protein